MDSNRDLYSVSEFILKALLGAHDYICISSNSCSQCFGTKKYVEIVREPFDM
jgi:hypothetical protein